MASCEYGTRATALTCVARPLPRIKRAEGRGPARSHEETCWIASNVWTLRLLAAPMRSGSAIHRNGFASFASCSSMKRLIAVRRSTSEQNTTLQVPPDWIRGAPSPAFGQDPLVGARRLVDAPTVHGVRGLECCVMGADHVDFLSTRHAVLDLSWGAGELPVAVALHVRADRGPIVHVRRSRERVAGAAALEDASGTVLATRSHDLFLGEDERKTASTEALVSECPNLRIVGLQGGIGIGIGIGFETSRLLSRAIAEISELRAVYSMGGGNRSILDMLADNGLRPTVYVAHDLDQENRELIAKERLDFILHHDLRSDIENVFNTFLMFHRLSTKEVAAPISTVQLVTPGNVPRHVRVP